MSSWLRSHWPSQLILPRHEGSQILLRSRLIAAVVAGVAGLTVPAATATARTEVTPTKAIRLRGSRWLIGCLVLVLGGCIDDGRPTSCDGPAEITLAVAEDSMTPPDPSVCRHQTVTLAIESDVGGVLHIHGYDDEAPATAIVAGESLELTFTASRSGQFPIELHADNDPRGQELGIFTVHEP